MPGRQAVGVGSLEIDVPVDRALDGGPCGDFGDAMVVRAWSGEVPTCPSADPPTRTVVELQLVGAWPTPTVQALGAADATSPRLTVL